MNLQRGAAREVGVPDCERHRALESRGRSAGSMLLPVTRIRTARPARRLSAISSEPIRSRRGADSLATASPAHECFGNEWHPEV